MGVRDRLQRAWQGLRYHASETSDFRSPSAWLSNLWAGHRTQAGVHINSHSALSVSAYFDAVRIISEDIGHLPLFVLERLEPRGKRRATEDSRYRLLHSQANPLMTAMTWRESLISYALRWGNGFAPILRDRTRIIALGAPIHPSRVTLQFNVNDELEYRVQTNVSPTVTHPTRGDSLPTVYMPGEMIHLRGLGEGLLGYSVAQFAAESLGLTLAAQQFGASFFGNGAQLGGVLMHPGKLSDTAAAHLKETWNTQKSTEKLETAVLEEDMKWARIGIPPNDAQFLETRMFQVAEIARWFRLPPHKLGDMTNATFSNIEQQSLDYVVGTLMPWIVRLEQELLNKLFLSSERFFPEVFTLGLLRGDSTSRANFYRTLFYLGALSPNDIRAAENLNPILDSDGDADPAGDMYFLQNNLSTINAVVDRPPPPMSPAPAAESEREITPEARFAANGHEKG